MLPSLLGASIKQLILEKLPSGQQFDLAVRDAKTSFTFFNIEGHQYDYDAQAQLLSIHGGRLLISNEFAKALGRPADAGVVAGKISVGAAMQPVEVTQLVNGEIKSVVMPPLGSANGRETPTLVPGPDVIVGELPEMAQYGNDTVNHLVGLGVGEVVAGQVGDGERAAVEALDRRERPRQQLDPAEREPLVQPLVDDLRLAIVPVLLGGGLRLLPDGVSAAWDLVSSTTLPAAFSSSPPTTPRTSLGNFSTSTAARFRGGDVTVSEEGPDQRKSFEAHSRNLLS